MLWGLVIILYNFVLLLVPGPAILDTAAVRLVFCEPGLKMMFIFQPQTVKKKKEGEEKRMTQEEMLLEAAQTGQVYNT